MRYTQRLYNNIAVYASGDAIAAVDTSTLLDGTEVYSTYGVGQSFYKLFKNFTYNGPPSDAAAIAAPNGKDWWLTEDYLTTTIARENPLLFKPLYIPTLILNDQNKIYINFLPSVPPPTAKNILANGKLTVTPDGSSFNIYDNRFLSTGSIIIQIVSTSSNNPAIKSVTLNNNYAAVVMAVAPGTCNLNYFYANASS